MGLREGAPEETHRDSHQPPLPSAVYNPNQGKTKGDDEMPELLNNVVHERGGRIRAHASKWDSLRDELGAAKTSFGMSLGDPLGKRCRVSRAQGIDGSDAGRRRDRGRYPSRDG